MSSEMIPSGWMLVPREPTEAMWDGLARAIVMWMDMGDKTPRALFKHLDRSGIAIPQWLRDEMEMMALDHVPSKGTRAVLVYRAMLAASPPPPAPLSVQALVEALEKIIAGDQARSWTGTAEIPEAHWEMYDGYYAKIAREALAKFKASAGEVG